MKNIKKLSLALTLAASFIAAPMFAQVESPRFYSNGFKSTANTIRTDTEDFIDVRYFDKVNLNKVFLTTNLTKSGFNLGAATKVNDYYLAGLYSGGFWESLNSSNTNTSTNTTNSNKTTPKNDNSSNINTIKSSSSAESNNNRIIFMLGLPNKMGLKLDSWLGFSNDNNLNRSKDYSTNKDSEEEKIEAIKDPENTSTEHINNEYEFNLVWSCFNIDGEKTDIKPWARIGVDMLDNRIIKTSKTINKALYPNDYTKNKDNVTTVKEVTYDPKHYPLLNVNLGADFTFKNFESFNQLLILNTGISARLYQKNRYVKNEAYTDNLNKNNNWTSNTVTTRDGKKDITTTLDATYKFDFKPIEKLTLAGRVGLNTSVNYWAIGTDTTTMTKNDIDGKDVYVNGELVMENGVALPEAKTKTSKNEYHIDTLFTPTFGIGVKYAVKPSFILNFGYGATLPIISLNKHVTETSTSSIGADETVTVNTNKQDDLSSKASDYSSSLSTGFTWSMGDCCALDVAVSITRTPSFKKVWDAGWNLGFTFKK